MSLTDERTLHTSNKIFYPYPSLNPIPSTGQAYGMWYYDKKDNATKTVREPDGWRPPTPYERRVKAGRLLGADVDIAYWAFGSDGLMKEAGSLNGAISSNSWCPSVPAFPQYLADRTVNKALVKLKDQKLNLAVAFGERRETAEFVGDTIRTGVSLARAIRKKDLKAIKRALSFQEKKKRPFNLSTPEVFKEVSDAPSKLVLTNSYAFQPLLNDCYGVMEELNRRDLDSPKRYKTKVIAQSSEDHFLREKEILAPVGYAEWEVYRTMRGFHSAKVRLDFYLDNPFLRTLSQLGITNPVSLAYELLPLSFVLDWFLPVGSYLDGLDATLGLQFRGGSLSLLTRCKHDWRFGNVTHPVYPVCVPVRKNMRSAHGKQNRLIRQTYVTPPRPVYPGFKNPWSGKHVGDALALLAQAVQGKSLHYR